MNQLRPILLLAALSALLVASGAQLGPNAFWLCAALALGLNLFAFFFSDRVVLRVHGARPLAPHEAPRLLALMAELSARAGIPAPRVFLMDAPHANAFATGRSSANAVVAVTRGLLEVLDERELRGVLGHELAHVKNGDTLVRSLAAGLAAAASHPGHALAWAGPIGGGSGEDLGRPAGGLLERVVAPVAAALVQLGFSRAREHLADEVGARLTGDPLALASALAKLHRSAEQLPSAATPATAGLHVVNPFGAAEGGLADLLSTHPSADERIRRLRALARELRGATCQEPGPLLRSRRALS